MKRLVFTLVIFASMLAVSCPGFAQEKAAEGGNEPNESLMKEIAAEEEAAKAAEAGANADTESDKRLAELALEEKKAAEARARKDAIDEDLDQKIDRLVRQKMGLVISELANEDVVNLDKTRKSLKADYKGVRLDLPIPENLVLGGIGLTPYRALLSSSPRKFWIDATAGIDDEGNFQTGFGLEVSPMQLILGEDLDQTRYRNSYWYRLLARSSVSYGLTAGLNDNDEATRTGFGFRFVLFDAGDPLLNLGLAGRIDEAIETPFANIDKQPRDAGLEKQRDFLRQTKSAQTAYNSEVRRKIREELAEARAESGLRSSFAIGYNWPAWISRDGRINKLKDNGGSLWASFAYGFDIPKRAFGDFMHRYVQLIFHVQYRYNEDTADPKFAGRYFERNRWVFSTRLRIGSPDLLFNVEFTYLYTDPERRNFRRDRYYRAAAGVEYRIAPNIWLDSSIGGIGRRDLGENEGVALIAIRFAL